MKLKEQLMELGIAEDVAQKVIDEVFDGKFIPKNRFDELNEELKQQKATVLDRDKQLDDLKKSAGDNAALQQQITDLQKANTEQKKAHDAEIAQLRLDNDVETALTAAGAKNSKAVKALLDTSKVKLGEDGKLTGWDKQLAAIQQSDSYLFAEKPQNQKFTGFQPGAAGKV